MDHSDLQQRIDRYWNDRSVGMDLATRYLLENGDPSTETVLDEACIRPGMRAVDMGTGCGLMAFALARRGLDVTGLDHAGSMIEEADRIASDIGLDVEFRVCDSHDTGLPDQSVDVVTAKDALWLLEDPVAAYQEWMRILVPGGTLIIIDGNYHLHQFNEDYLKRKNYLRMRDGPDSNLHASTNVNHVDLRRIDAIAEDLPLSREVRPAWDAGVLLSLGLHDIRIQCLDRDPFDILTENGRIALPFRFSIIARKTVGETVPPKQEDVLPMVAERTASIKESADRVSTVFSDPCRVVMLYALSISPLSVSDLAGITGMSISSASHGLRILKDAGMVTCRRDGQRMIYELSEADGLSASCSRLIRSLHRFRTDGPHMIGRSGMPLGIAPARRILSTSARPAATRRRQVSPPSPCRSSPASRS